ncbi:MAG: hypothetical protein ABID04_02890 [Patescibacteria group bacterium]
MHITLLLLGLPIILVVWIGNSPSVYYTYSYEVMCDNGKVFDPTSKPIEKYFNYRKGPLTFQEKGIKAECEYGNSWRIVEASKIPNNYKLNVKEDAHIVSTRLDQIVVTMIAVALYYCVIEILRRTLRYIFLGKKFFER